MNGWQYLIISMCFGEKGKKTDQKQPEGKNKAPEEQAQLPPPAQRPPHESQITSPRQKQQGNLYPSQQQPEGENKRSEKQGHLPPPAQRPLLTSSRQKQQGNLYLSRFNGELPEQRMRKSKTKSVKLNKSLDKSKVSETRLRMNDDVITVREEKPVLNVSTKGTPTISGFTSEEHQNKNFKKFVISSLVKERDLIKESNYFDESREGKEGKGESEIAPVVDKSSANFNIGEFESFQTFQIKTYLYDRNLYNNKIIV